MLNLSSPLAPKRQLKKLTASSTTLLAVIFFLALFVGSCQARAVRARGTVGLRNSPPHPAACKADSSVTKQMKDLSNANARGDACEDQVVDAEVKDGVAMASPAAVLTKNVVRVSERRLWHRVLQGEEEINTGFHLDYDGPRTHAPSHN